MICSNCGNSINENEPYADFKLYIKKGCSAELSLCYKCLSSDYWKNDRLIKKAEGIIGQNILNQSLNDKE